MECTLVLEKEFPQLSSVAIESSKSGHTFLVGCVDGKIRVIKDGNVCEAVNLLLMISKEEEVLETKGGSVQQILLADLTRFGELDLITADADGNVVLFCNRRILFRASVGHSISSLVIDSDLRGYKTLVTGDKAGVVTGLQLHHAPTPLWRAQLSTADHIYKPLANYDIPDTTVRCLLSVHLPPKDMTGKGLISNDRLTHFLLVAGSTPHIHFYTEGKRVYTLSVPSLVNSMCSGNFVEGNGNKTQIALGCENGFIYLLQNFETQKLINVGQTITQIQSLDLYNSENGSHDPMQADGNHTASNGKQTTMLLCSGHFNALKIYQKSKLAKEISTQDWVSTFDVSVKGEGKEATLVLGLANDTVNVYNMQNT